ncbi:MAG: acyl-CoA dehydrogenase family protein [Pseudomonadota bacterium]|jgi:alkylation response protein AidB-like acyl-CoA dehydrogenase
MALLTEEQVMLRDAAKAWVADKAPVSALRKLRDAGPGQGYDPVLWTEMGAMGWTGVIVPEDFGGSEFGLTSLGLVLEECGRTLVASPLLSTALVGASALILGGSEGQKAAWLPKIAAGEVVVAFALDEHPHFAPYRVATTAEAVDGGYRLSGQKTFVADGAAADLIIVVARTAGASGERAGLSLFLVDPGAKGVTREALATVDSHGFANLKLDQVRVSADAVLGEIGQGADLLDAILDRATAGASAEMLGAASQAFDITLDYLKTRTQFGQLIGSFQSLQHRAAKMFTDLELARSLVEAALEALDAGAKDACLLASAAKAKMSETLHGVSNEMVQMHGGIGMTDAHDAGLYMKRARVLEALYGGAAYHRDRFATLSGF